MAIILQKNHFEVIDLLAQSISLVPGFQYAYAFYHNPISKQIESSYANNTTISKVNTNSEQLSDSIIKLRSLKHKIEWVNQDEIPFVKHNNKIEIQKEVFDELKHHILLYRVKSSFDNNYDLLYIYFNADYSNFGISNSANGLTTYQKSIISTLVSNSFNIFLKQRTANNNAQNLLRDDMARMQDQLKEYKYSSEIKKYKALIKEYIYSKFDLQINKFNLIANYSAEVDSLMSNYKGNIDDVNNQVEQCVAMAFRMQNPIPGSILDIDEFVFQSFFNSNHKKNNSSANLTAIDSRKQKAIHFLNNLESAARVVMAKGNSITGTRVGQAMQSPISAPAISDYIKKYQKPLKQLCEENPELWVLVQKSFNPLKNILSA
ncbi:MAG: hypothetical protein KAG84_00690 [Bacteroidales bacterium]|nr:hypothetical protein [Bacteroidales bacterium]